MAKSAKKKIEKPSIRNLVLAPVRRPGEKRNFVLEYLGICKEEFCAGNRLEEGDYVQAMFNAWREYCRKLEIPPGTPSAFRTVISNLRKEGIIEHYATRPAERASFWNRNYYRISLE
jgi:hypothetical protein